MCKAFVSAGHDEYWDVRPHQTVTALRDADVSLLFLSGNAVCWASPFRRASTADRIASSPAAPYDSDDPWARIRQWDHGPFPERGPDEGRLIGARNVDPVNGGDDWTVAKPDHWIFDGTGVAKGDRVPGLVGWEYHGDPPADVPGLEVVAAGTAWQSGDRRRHWTATVYPPSTQRQGQLRIQRLDQLLGLEPEHPANAYTSVVPLEPPALAGSAGTADRA